MVNYGNAALNRDQKNSWLDGLNFCTALLTNKSRVISPRGLIRYSESGSDYGKSKKSCSSV